MRLKDLLLKNKSDILKRWFDNIVKTYPSESARFIKSNKNKFANPVGQTISVGIEPIFDELVGEMNAEKIFPFLHDIIKIRAVQDLNPSRALAFIFLLKNVVRDGFAGEIRRNDLYAELQDFESNIDALALFSFNMYMKCREKVYELSANELKRWTYRIVEKANQSSETDEEHPGNGNH